tara:strand:+ start:267 stop:515 length:249 start_codon:yes stop_codon:yes gene_type:complete
MRILSNEKDLSPGSLVRALRIRKGLTQHKLGLEVGKFSQEITAIETGSEKMGLKRARAFAKFFEIPYTRFLPVDAEETVEAD